MRRRGDTDYRMLAKINRFRPTGRTRTIERLIREAVAAGRPAPSDAEIGTLLAMPASRVAHHRRLAGL